MSMMTWLASWKKWKHISRVYCIGLLAFLFLIVKAKCCCNKEHRQSIIVEVCGQMPAAAIQCRGKKQRRLRPAGYMKSLALKLPLKKFLILYIKRNLIMG